MHGFRRNFQCFAGTVHYLVYFDHLSWFGASFVYSCYSCYSVLECYNLFSGVKLSITSLGFISLVASEDLKNKLYS